jgi:hypothetical protein
MASNINSTNPASNNFLNNTRDNSGGRNVASNFGGQNARMHQTLNVEDDKVSDNRDTTS